MVLLKSTRCSRVFAESFNSTKAKHDAQIGIAPPPGAYSLFFVICFSIMHMNRKNPWESRSIEEHLLEIVQMRAFTIEVEFIQNVETFRDHPVMTFQFWHHA